MKIACVQTDVGLGENSKNLERMIENFREATRLGAGLVLFPECALSGYCFESLGEAIPYAEQVPGPSVKAFHRECQQTNAFVVYGMLERDGDRLFNTALLVGPSGYVGRYRKVHLPYLGIDMFTTPGDEPFQVHQAGEVRIGMLICYDAAFPEASRALALAGADLIVLPTNWPPGAETTSKCVPSTRALENAVYFAAVNRVGTERGFPFIGQSQVIDPNGNTLAKLDHTQEEILYAEIDVARARNKHIIRVPAKHEIDRLADRRPEFYSTLLDPHELPNPRSRATDRM